MSMYPPKEQFPGNVYGPPPSYEAATAPGEPASSMPVRVEQQIFITMQFGDTPICMMCPNCGKEIMTRVTREISGVQHLACLIMFVFTFWICSCIPYCMDSLSHIRHTCPNCNAHIGSGSGS